MFPSGSDDRRFFQKNRYFRLNKIRHKTWHILIQAIWHFRSNHILTGVFFCFNECVTIPVESQFKQLLSYDNVAAKYLKERTETELSPAN